MSNDHTFCRLMLRETMEDVRKVTTAAERKTAWGYKYSGQEMVEFHGPDEFYWHGRGCCVYLARAKGWEAWLEKYHSELTGQTNV